MQALHLPGEAKLTVRRVLDHDHFTPKDRMSSVTWLLSHNSFACHRYVPKLRSIASGEIQPLTTDMSRRQSDSCEIMVASISS